MMDEMTSSLSQLMTDVNTMAARMEQLFSDTQFKNTHVLARTWYDTVDGYARLIEQYETEGTVPSPGVVNTIAVENYMAISNMRGLLTDSTTGALPLIMKSMGDAAPVSTSEHWTELDAYRENFLGVQAMALTNIAWAVEHDPTHAPKLTPGRDMTEQTLTTSYDLTGRPTPRTPTAAASCTTSGRTSPWSPRTVRSSPARPRPRSPRSSTAPP